MSIIIEGKPICGGLAVGRIRFWKRKEVAVVCRNDVDMEEEVRRYEEARKQAVLQTQALYEKAQRESGQENAQIFMTHQVMLEDEEYNAFVRYRITTERVNAEYAVATTRDHFSAMFLNMKDDYFRARSVDVKDVSGLLIRILTGEPKEHDEAKQTAEPYILAAEDLTPSETIQMEKTYLRGFVMQNASTHSHTAILAKTMNVPALTDIPVRQEWNGKRVIVDGNEGKLIVEPDAETWHDYCERMTCFGKDGMLQKYKGRRAADKNGRNIPVLANISDTSDLDSVLENDAEGIGLFRSEFLYLKEADFPSEDMLFRAYKQTAERMQGRKVIIRTIDIGADKSAEYFKLKEEQNPTLGYRAIRLCLRDERIFRTQLRAIFRAGAYGNVSILYPMITSLWEVKRIKTIAEEVKAELESQGMVYGDVEQGIMIETPAAALLSDVLAKEVDFFSIGTNDLTQYTLAADRQNPDMEPFYDSRHEAVLRLIRMVADNGHREGIAVEICGELAADTTMAEFFLNLEIDALSVAPAKVLAVRKAIMDNLEER